MAVVVAPQDVEQFLAYAKEENLEATEVAVVTEEPRLFLEWRGKEIVNISRAFLDTNGAHQETDVEVEMPKEEDNFFKRWNFRKSQMHYRKTIRRQHGLQILADLNVCSQKGLVEMFDGSIGAGSVIHAIRWKISADRDTDHGCKASGTERKMRYRNHDEPTDLIRILSTGVHTTDLYMRYWNPFPKIVTAGGDYRKVRFTFQEYFRRMNEDPKSWSQPFAALLGAYDAQMVLDFRLSVERIPCPEPLMILMYHRHWFLCSRCGKEDRMWSHRN